MRLLAGSNGMAVLAVAKTPKVEVALVLIVVMTFAAAGGAITPALNTGKATLPLTLAICQTDPVSGQCISPIDNARRSRGRSGRANLSGSRGDDTMEGVRHPVVPRVVTPAGGGHELGKFRGSALAACDHEHHVRHV
jgi:hypothetical protein